MKSDNIYYRARMQAAQRDPLYASRERTACEIFVSAEALGDYETGRTIPPCDVVQKMVEAYGDPDLKGGAHPRLLPAAAGLRKRREQRAGPCRTWVGCGLRERTANRPAVCCRRP